MSVLEVLYRVIPSNVYDLIFPLYSRCRFATEYRDVIGILSDICDKDNEAAELFEYMRKTGFIRFYYGDWIDEISDMEIKLKKQKDSGEYYVVHSMENGKRERNIFFPKWMKKTFCYTYYRSLLQEQDERSPHFYFSDRVKEKILSGNGLVLDIGSSEGIFALQALGTSNKCICFEPDIRWKEPFTHTFSEEYGKRIRMINSFISDHTEGNTISIDDFFDRSMPDNISVIKMDIEGEEQKAHLGMRKTLEANPSAIVLVCAYHTQEAEKEIREILEPMGYTVTPRRGYMFTYAMPGFERPYIRHGVLEAVKTG